MNATLCPACGADWSAEHGVCASCGSAALICPQCSRPVSPNHRFCPDCGAALADAAPASSERRVVTMVFCDLEGSTPLADRLDPEDYALVLEDFYRRAAVQIEAAGGHILKLQGDGLLAYFGFPQAHEDDASRAVRACLSIADENRSENRELSVRIAVHTGLVLVADSVAGAMRHQHDVFGTTPAVVTRINHEAPPNGVVVSESTYRLVPYEFEFERLGSRQLRGIAGAIDLFQPVRYLGDQARDGPEPPPFAGRVRELEMLDAAFDEAARGEGRVTLISGEPGIGKTRLVGELFRRRGVRPTVVQCHEGDDSRAFGPFLDELRSRALEAGNDGEIEESLVEIMRNAGVDESSSRSLALLGLLGLGSGEGALEQAFPEELPTLIDEALIALLPVVTSGLRCLVVEDLQWADSETLDIVSRLVHGAPPVPGLLVVCTFRNTFMPPWTALLPHVDAAQLNRLPPRDLHTIVDPVVDARAREDVVRSSEGIPLFAVELARYVRDHPDSPPDSQDRLLSVPGSIVELLIARLDSLGEARTTALVCSVVGNDIDEHLIEGLFDRDNFRPHLAELQRAGVLMRIRSVPRPVYRFSHVLYRDVAYHTLTRERRQELHARVADLPELADRPGLRGQHLESAGEFERAFSAYNRACTKALKHNLWQEARSWWQRATTLIESQGITTVEAAKHLSLSAGMAFSDTLEWSEIRRHTEKALEIYREAGVQHAIAQALLNLAASYASVRHPEYLDPEAAIRYIELADEVIEESRSGPLAVIRHTYASNIHRLFGEQEAAFDASSSAVSLARDIGNPALIALGEMTHGISVLARGHLKDGFALLDSCVRRLEISDGSSQSVAQATVAVTAAAQTAIVSRRPMEGLAFVQRELALKRQGPRGRASLELLEAVCQLILGRPAMANVAAPAQWETQPLATALWLSWLEGPDAALPRLEQQIQVRSDHGALGESAELDAHLGHILLRAGSYEAAISPLRRATAHLEGMPVYYLYATLPLAFALAMMGDVQEANQTLASAQPLHARTEGAFRGWARLAEAVIAMAASDDPAGYESPLRDASAMLKADGLIWDEAWAAGVEADAYATLGDSPVATAKRKTADALQARLRRSVLGSGRSGD